jgi:hypothetical protein
LTAEFERSPDWVHLALATGAFDAECIEDSVSYRDVLRSYAEASGGVFGPQKIKASVSFSSERAKISYELSGEPFSRSIPCESDYFEPEAHDFINDTLEKTGCKQRFFMLPSPDQFIYLVFIEPSVHSAAVRRGLIPRGGSN